MNTLDHSRGVILPTNAFTIHNLYGENASRVKNSVNEILDIYQETITEDGKLAFIKKSSIDREIAHREGLLHVCAHIWAYNSKGEVLLQKRSLKKSSSPGKWDISAAGHLETGDTVISGAIREIQEELGIEVSESDLNLVAGFRNEAKRIQGGETTHNNEIAPIFLMKFDGNISDLSFNQDEVAGFRFIPLPQLEKDWSDNETLKLYTSKGNEYQKTILKSLKKVCN